jgi:hypothetical protein
MREGDLIIGNKILFDHLWEYKKSYDDKINGKELTHNELLGTQSRKLHSRVQKFPLFGMLFNI